MNIKEYSTAELVELSKSHNAKVKAAYQIDEGGEAMQDMILQHTFEAACIPYIELPRYQCRSGHEEIFEFEWREETNAN